MYILNRINNSLDLSLYEEEPCIRYVYAILIRKELITKDLKITLLGKDLLKYLESDVSTKIIKKKITDTDFDKWWANYPSTDTFKHRGKQYTGSRALRINKPKCKKEFNTIINEGDHNVDKLIEALKYELIQKKNASDKENTNKLSFMQNTLTYLKQRTFEAYLDLISDTTIKNSTNTRAINRGTDV